MHKEQMSVKELILINIFKYAYKDLYLVFTYYSVRESTLIKTKIILELPSENSFHLNIFLYLRRNVLNNINILKS